MTPVDALSPDQRAVLQLLLKQGRRYEELAALLRIDPGAVRQRAVSALDALGPATELSAGRRAELTDWLLGQQDAASAAQTTDYLEDSPAGRAWAAAVIDELRDAGLGGDRLPDLPGGETAPPAPEVEPVSEPFPAHGEESEPKPPRPAHHEPAAERMPGFASAPSAGDRAPASKLGGALLLAGIVIVVAVLLVWVLSRDGDADSGSATVATGTQPATTATTTTPADQPRIVGQVNLASPGGGKALGVANVLAQGDQRAVAIRAQDLEPNTNRNAYGVWLTGGPGGRVTRLGFAPAVGRNGRLEGATSLPEDATDYDRLVISLETSEDPRKPADVALSGRLRIS